MSVEVKLVPLNYDRRWEIHIIINTPTLGLSSETIISLEEPYRASLNDWRKITNGDCAMRLLHGFSLDDGYYQFSSNSEYGTNFNTQIKEEVLREKLSVIIDEAIELRLRFDSDYDDDEDPSSDED